MKCIACATELEPADHEGVAVDRCPQGCGVWLDRGELQLVVQREQLDRPEEQERAELQAARVSLERLMQDLQSEDTRRCPVCEGPMRKVDYAWSTGIVLDRCSEHGVWLDTDELERVEAFAEGMRRPLVALPRGESFVSGIALFEQLHRT